VSSIRPLCVLYQVSLCPLSGLFVSSIRSLCVLYQVSLCPLSGLFVSSIRSLCVLYQVTCITASSRSYGYVIPLGLKAAMNSYVCLCVCVYMYVCMYVYTRTLARTHTYRLPPKFNTSNISNIKSLGGSLPCLPNLYYSLP